jgi:GNAT superfamily N-acetyltransferase
MLIPFTSSQYDTALSIWETAAHPDYPLNARLLEHNALPCTGESVEGRLAIHNGDPLGFILAYADGSTGWVGLLAVDPAARRRGIGSELLAWAETWIGEQGCKRIRIGGNLRPFFPGLPYAMREHLSFFEKRGYQTDPEQPYEYDIARSLEGYQPVYTKPAGANLILMQAGQEALLLEFLQREYPGRWEFEAREFVRNGGRPEDYLLLWVESKVEGFCRLTREDSERPIERFYPQRLPHPWGQFGPLGISKAVRGQGLGGYMIDAAAAHLSSLGVKGCIIDWTSLVDLYGKFGFTIYNQYISLFKAIDK